MEFAVVYTWCDISALVFGAVRVGFYNQEIEHQFC